MSYRPYEQALEPGIRLIIQGIDQITNAIIERIKSDEWKETHINELKNLSNKLSLVKLELLTLNTETW